ncbi:MAG: DUF6056 family protein [Muribaculaceae bacterium]|nr:DUF6056 family protein [Muribaculaceae bacterium]
MFWLTPYNHDDLYYRLPYRVIPQVETGVESNDKASAIDVRLPSAGEFYSFVVDHYLHNNGRFGDKLLTLALLLPKLLFALMSGIAVYLILTAGRYVSSDLRGPRSRIICGSLMVLCLPWYDLMFTGAFAVNYLWGGALALVCVGYMAGRLTMKSVPTNIAGCILMLLGGAWHEGFAMTVGSGMFVYLCCNKFRVNRIQILYWLIWMCGAALVICSPSSWERMESTGSPFMVDRIFSLETLAYFNITLLYIPLLLISVIVKKIRARISTDMRNMLIGIAVMFLVNIYIVGRTYWVPRIAMFSMLFSIPGLILLTKVLLPNAGKRIKLTTCAVIMVATFINLVSSLYWQCKICDEYEDISHLYLSQKPGTAIYYDLTTENSLPWYTLGKPSGYLFHNAWGMNTFSMYYERGELNILPTALKDINPPKDGSPIKSNKFKLWRVKGYLVAEGFPEGRSRKVLCKTANGVAQWINVMVTPITGADGKNYEYLEPMYILSDDTGEIVKMPRYRKDK